jgi:hypothetical protein
MDRANKRALTVSKRPFLLLEVLIALSLVTLCAIPLIVKPIRAYRSEIAHLEAIERERLADWTFSEIQEQLYKNAIPWERLPNFQRTTGPFSLNESTIHIPGIKPKQIGRSFTLYGQGEKQNNRREIFRMIYVTIEFQPPFAKKNKIYTYRTIVKRILKPDPITEKNLQEGAFQQ